MENWTCKKDFSEWLVRKVAIVLRRWKANELNYMDASRELVALGLSLEQALSLLART